MIQRRLILITLAVLMLCAGCCHGRNRSGWGHSPQTAVPVETSLANPPAPLPDEVRQPGEIPPPCNPPNFCAPGGEVQFSINADDQQLSMGSHFHDDMSELWPEIKQDYRNYYCWDNLGMLAAGFGAAALMANSQSDRELREQYQEHIRGPSGNQFSAWCKEFGNGALMIPVIAAGWIGGDIMYDWPAGSVIGEWGERSFRSLLVGAPPMLIMQWVTGGARPGEDDDGSGWRPFTHSNGVSGHAFIGGVVFIDAAKMTDNPWLKAGFYACSFLPAWSRINDDAHFPSQALLGWWMAYCAASAVDTTQRHQSDWRVVPLPVDDGVGMAFMYQY